MTGNAMSQNVLEAIIKAIRGVGIPVVQIGPEETLDGVTRKIGQLMRRRR